MLPAAQVCHAGDPAACQRLHGVVVSQTEKRPAKVPPTHGVMLRTFRIPGVAARSMDAGFDIGEHHRRQPAMGASR